MDRRAKLVVLICTLFMINDVAESHQKKMCACCGCSSLIGLVSVIYRGWNMLGWASDFAELLQKDVTDPRDIKDIPLWLLKNPPPFESKFTVVRYILKYVLDENTLVVLRNPEYFKNLFCTNNEQCDSGKDFLKFFSSYED